MMSPEHVAHPYPTEQEKAQIMADTGIELKQLTNWFVNNRKRYWKPRVEAKLQQRFASAASSESSSSNSCSPVSVPSAAGQGVAGGALPLSISQAHQAALLQNAAAAGVARKRTNEYEAHAISVGSASSSTCNSDDESIETGSGSSLSSASRNNRLDGSNPLHASLMGAAASLRREEVDVYVLRPETDDAYALPTIREMTIKSNAPADRILATFPKIGIHYTIPKEIENDRKKIQTRRDGEVLRVKKHYLKLYLATRGIHSVSSPLGDKSVYAEDKPNNVSLPTSPYLAENVGINTSPSTPPDEAVLSSKAKPFLSNSNYGEDVTSALHTVSPTLAFHKNAFGRRPRAFTCTALEDNNNEATIQRKRARTSSAINGGEEEWRELCLNAQSLHCDSLPGLEEATRMFGYAC